MQLPNVGNKKGRTLVYKIFYYLKTIISSIFKLLAFFCSLGLIQMVMDKDESKKPKKLN